MKHLLPLSLFLLQVHSLWASPIEWPQEAIHASVIRDDVHQHGQFLQLDRQLKEGQYGWKRMRMSLPDAWKIKEAAVEADGFALHLADHRVFRVSKAEIGDLSFRILDGGQKTQEQLGKLWAPYEKKG
jgi:hypothetical protein